MDQDDKDRLDAEFDDSDEVRMWWGWWPIGMGIAVLILIAIFA